MGFLLLLFLAAPLAAAPAAEVSDEEALAAQRLLDGGLFFFEPRREPRPGEVELGRQLFFDPRLSRTGAMSCATCHNPSLAWADGLPRAMGTGHVPLRRNTPSLLNVRAILDQFFWDGRARTLEEAVLTALRDRTEMSGDAAYTLPRLRKISGYVRQFRAVYGEPVAEARLGQAVAAFIREEIKPRGSAFERFRTDHAALSQPQRRGLKLFVGKARCFICHVGPDLTDNFYRDVGLAPIPGVEDPGRYAVTPTPSTWRAFRTQPLWDVASTAPYMHDGSLKTLEEVVKFYDRGGEGKDPVIVPLRLSPEEKDDLVAFLGALTSRAEPVAVPNLPVEDASPSDP